MKNISVWKENWISETVNWQQHKYSVKKKSWEKVLYIKFWVKSEKVIFHCLKLQQKEFFVQKISLNFFIQTFKKWKSFCKIDVSIPIH